MSDTSINQINMKLEMAAFRSRDYRRFFVNAFRRYLLDAGFSYRDMLAMHGADRVELWDMFAKDTE